MCFRSAAIAARVWRAAVRLPPFSISSSAQVKYCIAASASALRRQVIACCWYRIGRNASEKSTSKGTAEPGSEYLHGPTHVVSEHITQFDSLGQIDNSPMRLSGAVR